MSQVSLKSNPEAEKIAKYAASAHDYADSLQRCADLSQKEADEAWRIVETMGDHQVRSGAVAYATRLQKLADFHQREADRHLRNAQRLEQAALRLRETGCRGNQLLATELRAIFDYEQGQGGTPRRGPSRSSLERIVAFDKKRTQRNLRSSKRYGQVS